MARPLRKPLIVLLSVAAAALAWLLFHGNKPAASPPAPPPPVSEAPPPPSPEPVPPPAVPPPAPLAAPEALSRGEALLKKGQAEEGARLLERALEADPDGKAGKRAARLLADHYAALKMERRALGYRLRSELTAKEREEAEAKAKEIGSRIFGGAPSPEDASVPVAKDETLGGIAKRFGTTPECLARVNGIKDMHRIVEGQRLKVIRGTFRVLVEKGPRRLTLLLDGVPVRSYPVGIGADGKTPTARFVIEEKLTDPPWSPPGRAPIPFGHPDNILGTRWMGFNRSAEYSGFGIHGTTRPDSVGKATSNGCVRMLNEDVEELFDLVPRGTAVEIRD